MVIRHNEISGNQSLDWGSVNTKCIVVTTAGATAHDLHFALTILDTVRKSPLYYSSKLGVISSGMSLYLFGVP
jgi:hypothetical protein